MEYFLNNYNDVNMYLVKGNKEECITCSDYAVIIITSGTGFFSIDGTVEEQFQKGSFSFISSKEYITIKSYRPFEYLRIDFKGLYLKKNLTKFFDVRNIPLTGILSKEDFKCMEYFAKTLHERLSKEKNELSTEYVYCLVEEIIILLSGYSNIEKEQPLNERLNSALLYIMENFKLSISVKDCAKAIGCSDNVLRNMFARNLNITFNKFLNDIRLKYAMQLIICTNIPITDVCYESGFNTLSFFSKLFKEKYNIPPKEIRNRGSFF